MIKKLALDPRNPGAIRDEILGLRFSDATLHIPGGARQMDRERWIEVIMNDVGLLPDTRHFDPKWAADYAEKRRVVALAGGEQAEGEFDKQQQFAPAYWWEVSYQPDKASAYSYSKTRQPLHSDNAWFADPAEINFFIMQKQAPSGGEQTIYPITRLIEDLSTEEPGLFRDVTNVKVTVRKGEGDAFNHTTIIKLGDNPKIFWNYYRTEKPTPEIQAMCDALFKWFEGKESTPSVERLRCESGDCFAFNDQKLVHGRTAFEASLPYDRVLLQSGWRLPRAQ
jgi:hypothetical protein